MSKNDDKAAPVTGANGTHAEDAIAEPARGADSNLAVAARKSAGKSVWMGTAVGIGSAAIVAALLYSRKTN